MTHHGARDIPDSRLLKYPDGQKLGLILGILPNGASHLLLPSSRFEALGRAKPRCRSHPLDKFSSLSPIHFANLAELQKKLKFHASTKSQKKVAEKDQCDRSKANQSFATAGDGPSDAGRARSSFELQRVLLLSRPMLAEIDNQAIELALQQLPEHVNVVSLCYNAWTADTRTFEQRKTDPKVLDIGWTLWSKLAKWNEFQLTPSSTTHIIVQEERLLGNPGLKRIECEYTTTTYEKRSEIAWRFTAALTGRHPVVLLVHDEARTLSTLSALGVDTAAWKLGIAALLYGDARVPGRAEFRSSRSRSPRRRGQDAQDRERHTSGTPVYVVDVRRLYLALREIAPTTDSVPINARGLEVYLDLPKDKPDAVTPTLTAASDRWWCAGTESLLLGKMWYSMARGPNIDDQRTLRWSSASTGAAIANTFVQNTSVPPAGVEDGNDSDDDVDPNDIVPAAAVPSSSKPSIGNKGLCLMDPTAWDDYSD